MKSKILKALFYPMILPTLSVSGGAFDYRDKPIEKQCLKFSSDGKFRILHLTDIHLIVAEMEEELPIEQTRLEIANTINCISEAIEKTKPDLVVCTGDNVSSNWELITYSYVAQAIRYITNTVKKYNLPLAVVFGNHDAERNMHKEFQMRIFMEYDNFRGIYNERENIYGVGNYNLPIMSSDGKDVKFNLWMFDSNDYLDGIKGTGYDCVHKSQLDWYINKSDELKSRNNGQAVPSIFFQHIPLPEVLHILEKSKTDNGGINDGTYFYSLPKNAKGVLGEMPCPPMKRYDNQFEVMKKQGDIIAGFFGHDHVNNFDVEVDGIRLIQTFCAGYTTYGDKRGGRLIVIDEKNLKNVYTESFTIDWKEEKELKEIFGKSYGKEYTL